MPNTTKLKLLDLPLEVFETLLLSLDELSLFQLNVTNKGLRCILDKQIERTDFKERFPLFCQHHKAHKQWNKQKNDQSGASELKRRAQQVKQKLIQQYRTQIRTLKTNAIELHNALTQLLASIDQNIQDDVPDTEILITNAKALENNLKAQIEAFPIVVKNNEDLFITYTMISSINVILLSLAIVTLPPIIPLLALLQLLFAAICISIILPTAAGIANYFLGRSHFQNQLETLHTQLSNTIQNESVMNAALYEENITQLLRLHYSQLSPTWISLTDDEADMDFDETLSQLTVRSRA